MAAPAFVAAGLGPTTSSTSTTIPKPAGTVAGHVLYALVTNGGAATAPSTVPSGWALTYGLVTGGGGWVGVYEHVAGGSEPSSYTWSGFTDSCAGSMVAVSGADTTTPTHKVHATATLNSSVPTDSGVTTTVTDCLIVAGCGIGDNTSVNTWTSTGDPAALTERTEVQSTGGSDTTSALASAPQAAMGATGTLTVALAGSRNSIVFTIAVQPPQTGGGGTTQPAGTAGEADTAQPLGKAKSAATGFSGTVDTAQALSRGKTLAAAPAGTLAAAQPIGHYRARTASPAAAAETAQPIGAAKTHPVATATAVDAAQLPSAGKARPVGAAGHATTAQQLLAAKTRSVGTAGETSTAQTLAASGATRQPAPTAGEHDQAQALTAAKTRPLGIAAGSAAAQPITVRKTRPVAAATETDAARPMGRVKKRAAGAASEIDAATPVTTPSALQVPAAPAHETATALPLGRSKACGVTHAGPAEAAQRFGCRKTVLVGAAAATSAANPVSHAKARRVLPAAETDTGMSLLGEPQLVPGVLTVTATTASHTVSVVSAITATAGPAAILEVTT